VGFARLQADGSSDGVFNSNVGVVDGAVKCITLNPLGYALIGGYFSTASAVSQSGAALYDWNGNIVSTWDACGGALGSVEAATLQYGNAIIIGGTFSAFDGRSVQNYDRVLVPE